MAGEETPNEKTPRRRRPAATIDLPASEVSPDTVAASESREATQAAAPEVTAPVPPGNASSIIAGAVAAAIVVLIAGGALWWLGLIHGGDRSEISARLTRIEALATRTTSSTEAKISDDISARIAKLEAALNAPPVNDATLMARIGTLETSVKAVLDSVSGLHGRNDDHAAASREMRAQLEAARQAVSDLRVTVERQASGAGDKGELDRMAARVGALETATKTVQQNIDPQQGISADRAVRRALLATALRERVTRGGPFAAELTAVKAVSDDAGSLAPLEPFAARGLPPADAFCAELAAILPRISSPRDGAPRGNTFVERLQARASQLVRIRPIGETAGDDAATVLGRVELKAARGDVDGALADLLRLPAETRAPAADWISRAQARQAALAAARTIETNALAALGQSVQQK